MPSVPPAIETKDLTRLYAQRQGVAGLTLSVPAGQVLGLLGPNGAGKTTVLKLLAGLLAPDAGHVCLNGHDLALEGELARQQVAAVVQGQGLVHTGPCSPMPLRLGANVDGAKPDWHAQRDLPVRERLGDPAEGLSHGLQRQATLAQAFSAVQPILLLDEPTAGLDERAADAVKTWVRKLAHEQNRTVVVGTCRGELVQEICDRVAILRDGRLVTDVPVHRQLGLSQPATYRIRVQGRLDERWTRRFDGLTVTTVGDETVIAGTIVDQPALHGLLARLRDLGLPLIAVQRAVPWGEPDPGQYLEP